jgi:hypothetical protein
MNDELRAYLNQFGNGNYMLSVDKVPLKRSLAQNNYFRGVIVKYYQDFWKDSKGFFHKDIIKGILCKKFLTQEEVCEVTGEVFTIVRNTSDLTSCEFDLFIQECRLYHQHESGEIIPYTQFYRGQENGKN